MTQPPDDPYFRPPPIQQPYGHPHGAPAHYPAPPPGWQPYSPAPPTPGGKPLAAPGWRLLARIIDGFIAALVGLPFLGPIYYLLFKHVFDKIQDSIDATQPGQPAPTPQIYDAYFFKLYALALLVGLIVSALYEVPQIAVWGRTLGKRICHVRVVHRDGRARVGLGPAILRWLATSLAPLVPFAGGIYSLLDSLWLLWDRPWSQCLHDKAASTIVVRDP